MRFEGGDATKFLAEFRLTCDNAEITEPQVIKNRLLRTYPSNEFFKNEFSKRVSDVTSINDIYSIYSEVVSDSSKVIKYGPDNLIAIKHPETERYLSSCEINYQTGSKRQLLFAGEKIRNENAWWYLTCETPTQKKEFQENNVLYDDMVYLTHNKTKTTLCLSEFFKSPVTAHAEVHCFTFAYATLRFNKTDQTNENKTPYLKTRDRVYIRTDTDYTLRSQDATFVIEEVGNDNRTFQEVVGHKENVGKDDEWLIEKK